MLITSEANVKRLLLALSTHYDKEHSFFPVDTQTVLQAMNEVNSAQKSQGMSPSGRMERILGGDKTVDAPLEKLANLARALIDYDDNIRDALLYLDGKLL